MKRVNNKKNLYKSIILLVIVVIGIGYAYLTSNLSISGQTEVVANTWNIHFENLSVKEGSVTASTPATIDSNNTSISYAITLSRPKEYYEFTVGVKNDGTLPGKVSISTLSGLDTTSSKVIDYSINYIGGNSVNIGDILNAGAKKTIKVRVFYKDDISASDFPSNNLNLNLTYTLQYVQSEEDVFDAGALIEKLKTENSSCFTKYEGQVTDQVGETVTASNVYFNKCADKRNIIFNNMCWQMIRTTETGGIKMIYNGEPDNNDECGSSRGNHKGIVGDTGVTVTLTGQYLYGNSFTYDLSTNVFTLTDTFMGSWSDSTYQNLQGTFTCKNTTGICTTIYNVNGYISNESAFGASYIINNTNYGSIGVSVFNSHYKSPSMVGYMFNKVYKYKEGAPTSGSLMGNGVSYSNGTYTLLPADGESALGTSLNDNHHYTCNNTSGTCDKVRYYYNYSGSYKYYIELDGDANIEEAINSMLYNDNVNKYNSSIKGIIDAWYKHSLSSKTNMLEDIVYCNNRDITIYGGWDPNGGSGLTFMYYKGYNLTKDLSCTNVTDQFSLSNNKAKLQYPVGMISHEELYNTTSTPGSYSLINISDWYWGISPYMFSSESAEVRYVSSTGNINNCNSTYSNGRVRPAISLMEGTVITGGEGSETNPWIVD